MGWKNGLTQEENAFIKEHFNDMNLDEIALSLGRSYSAIRNQAARMGLHRIHRWTEEEDKVLLSLCGQYTATFIARQIGVDVTSVYNRIRRLKINGKYKYASKVRPLK